ncbi:MAG: hypothetical protein RIC93_10615 [Alphaproteobacteria bacterium]
MTDVTESRHRWAEKFPFLGTNPIDTRQCYSAEHFELEKEKIFKKVWWQVARVEELPKKGSYKVRRLDFADTSVC